MVFGFFVVAFFASGRVTFTKRMNLTKFTNFFKSDKIGVQLKIDNCILNAKRHSIVCTSELLFVQLSNCKECDKNFMVSALYCLCIVSTGI